jgi:hypothetical protein
MLYGDWGEVAVKYTETGKRHKGQGVGPARKAFRPTENMADRVPQPIVRPR